MGEIRCKYQLPENDTPEKIILKHFRTIACIVARAPIYSANNNDTIRILSSRAKNK